METLESIKAAIWNSKQIHRNPVDLQVYADKAGVRLPITEIGEAEKLLKSLTRKIKRKVETPACVWQRLRDAKLQYETVKFPNWIKDGHFLEPELPDLGTSNGLTSFIVDYLTWAGHFANRTGNEGRVIMKEGKATRIHSSSKKGMQDIDTNLNHPQHPFGIPWKIEIKVGADKLSDKQIDYGKEVARTGAVYSVVRDAEDFFAQLDKLLTLAPAALKLF